MAQAVRSLWMGQIRRKPLTQFWFVSEEQQIYLNLWSVAILSISTEQVNQKCRLVVFYGSEIDCAYI